MSESHTSLYSSLNDRPQAFLPAEFISRQEASCCKLAGEFRTSISAYRFVSKEKGNAWMSSEIDVVVEAVWSAFDMPTSRGLIGSFEISVIKGEGA
jgi:hypothetical protein